MIVCSVMPLPAIPSLGAAGYARQAKGASTCGLSASVLSLITLGIVSGRGEDATSPGGYAMP